jgi:LytS/YehU family sensor histidine kinase
MNIGWIFFMIPGGPILWLFFGCAIVGLFVLWKQNNKLKKRLHLLNESQILVNLENGFLKKDLSPHFIFNVMSAIQHLVLEGEKNQAVRYVTILGKYIRISMENSSHDKIDFDKLVVSLNNYVHLENLRFQKNITLHFSIKNQLKQHFIEYPYHLIQTEIKRIINEHLRYEKDLEQHISIHISEDKKEIIIMIQPGQDEPIELKNQHSKLKLDKFGDIPPEKSIDRYATIRFSA